ncbi:MAG TPA: hypothetical protein VGX00_06225 [Thermoplasmata archaeon]|nr:hypothetical protein [Thermoplasmata archaeon]
MTRQPSGPPLSAKSTQGSTSRSGGRVGRYGGFARMRVTGRSPRARSVRTGWIGQPARRARARSPRNAAGFRSVATTVQPWRAASIEAWPAPQPISRSHPAPGARAYGSIMSESSRGG